ncbi:hypothetical protein D3C77_615430 [compost metagenome]
MIVKHDREVIGRNAILLDDDEITARLGLERDLAFDQIVERIRASLRHAEADARLPSLSLIGGALLRRQIPVLAGIARRLSAGHLLLALQLQLLFRTVAAVSQPFVEKLLPIFAVNIQPLRLAVRAVVSADVDALVPFDAKPLQIS